MEVPHKLLVILLLAIFPSTFCSVNAQSEYSFQVGAVGDQAAEANMGVSAAIRTRTYPVVSDDANSFWVGDNLGNGAFIQFGFILHTPKAYCLKGVVTGSQSKCTGSVENIESADARWFWQYWPNGTGNTFYYGIGGTGSAGANGTWHTYTIEPDPANGWQFLLDNETIGSVPFQWVRSQSPVYVVAEEVTSLPFANGELGPVEFENLTYLKSDGWHPVSLLGAISECGGANPSCGIAIPYGVSIIGAGHIIAGAGMVPRQSGELLWTIHFNLELIVPSGADVTVDDKDYGSGILQLSLPIGPHTLYIPNIIQIDNADRLHFSHWSDGVREYNRTIFLTSELTLNVSYAWQFKLTVDSSLPASGAGWYDKGSIASFSVPPTEALPPPLGLIGGRSNFQGWYESGRLVTSSPNASIVMDAPHDLVALSAPDYTQPSIVTATAIATVALLLLYYRRRKTNAVVH